MIMKKRTAAYTTGPIPITMLKNSCAMLAGTLAMSGYNIADTYFVGRMEGQSPLAARGFTFPIIMLVGCLFHGIGIGVVTPAAQALGAEKRKRAVRLVSGGVVLMVLTAVVLAIVGMATSECFFNVYGATGETLEMVTGYMNIWFFGCVTAALSMGGNSILIAVGDSKFASGMMIAGMVVNVVLDPWFIFGGAGVPAMGIKGAALATVISQAFSAIVIMLILNLRHKLLRFGIIPWRELKIVWKKEVFFAIPSTIGMLMMPAGSFIITGITAHFGDAVMGATAASGRLEMVAFVFPMSIGMTLLPMIGQNFGAKLYSRIRECRKFSMGFAFIFLNLLAVFYFIFAPELVGLFTKDPEIRDVMIVCMRIIPWGFAMTEIHRFSGFFYTGCGRPAAAAWLNALRIMGLMVPFSFIALLFNHWVWLFVARLAADIIAGSAGFAASHIMLSRLPADGMNPPAANRNWYGQKIRRDLQAQAVAQADIDNRSSTQ